MNVFTLFGLIILIVGLTQDYKRDKGQHAKAKVYHAICLTILMIGYAGSFRILGFLLRNFDKAQERFSVDVGLVPGRLHFIFYLLHSALAMTVIVLAYQMIKRSDKSRKLLITLLPFLGVLEVFSFYRGWIIDGDDLGVNHGVLILVGFLLVGGLTTFIVVVYRSGFMRTFFEKTPQAQALTEEQKAVQDSN